MKRTWAAIMALICSVTEPPAALASVSAASILSKVRSWQKNRISSLPRNSGRGFRATDPPRRRSHACWFRNTLDAGKPWRQRAIFPGGAYRRGDARGRNPLELNPRSNFEPWFDDRRSPRTGSTTRLRRAVYRLDHRYHQVSIRQFRSLYIEFTVQRPCINMFHPMGQPSVTRAFDGFTAEPLTNGY